MQWPSSIDFDAFAGPRAAALRLHRSPRLPVWGALVFSFAWFYWRRLYVVGSLMPMPFILPVMFRLPLHFSGSVAIVLLLGLILPPLLARPIYALPVCNVADAPTGLVCRARRAAPTWNRLEVSRGWAAWWQERSGTSPSAPS